LFGNFKKLKIFVKLNYFVKYSCNHAQYALEIRSFKEVLEIKRCILNIKEEFEKQI
jgi:hypothetical protein